MHKTLLIASLLTLTMCACAQDEEAPKDAEGCKDSPLITRMPGSIIHACDKKEFDQKAMPVAADTEKPIEGELESWDYGTRPGVSDIQVFRNFEAALKQAGFHIVYEISPGTITANKGNVWCLIENSGSYYYQTIVKAKEMQQEVQADASSISDELEKSGHVAIYGIQFATNKADILPDSEKTLQQIAQALAQHPDLKLRIEGYTDNVGQAAANQALSQKRADAVKAWLTAHSVAADRMTTKGMGAANPVADNSTEEGREKNRRVELVKVSS